MAHVAIAWEIGAGFGHLVPIAAIGVALRQQGHDVTALLPPGTRGPAFLRSTGLAVEEQPMVPAPPRTSWRHPASTSVGPRSVGFGRAPRGGGH